MFDNKVLLITGGTGSFGNAVLDRVLHQQFSEIRIFSRDEKKQDDMRIALRDERLKFYIGDVRDYASVDDAMHGVDYVFHAAALKQVPSCEFYPMEAIRTNVNGAENVMRAAVEHKVSRCVVLSTDKAVYPINAMGMSKALMEKVMVAKSRLTMERLSRNTQENAEFSKALVKPKSGERWLLVTSAYHMPRSVGLFRKAGFPVEPYPVDWRVGGSSALLELSNLEDDGLGRTDLGFREWLGLLAYWITGKIDSPFPGPNN